MLLPFTGCTQQPAKEMSVNPMALYGLDSTIASQLKKDLEVFLDDVKNNPFQSRVIEKSFIEQDPDAFVFFSTVDADGTYQPLLMQVTPLSASTFIVKLAHTRTDESNTTIHSIYNLLAEKREKGFVFFSPSLYYTAAMQTYRSGSITYKYTGSIDKTACKKMDLINQRIATLFQQPVKEVTYYKFKNAVALFNHLGFDYLPNMHLDSTGGIIKYEAGQVLAANNSEIYEHEFVHLYTRGLNNGQVNHYADEGVATLIGGSGGIMYAAGIKKIYDRIIEKNITNIYEGFVADFQIDKKVSVKYFLSALICKLIRDRKGMTGLAEVLKAGNTVDDFFSKTNELLQLNEQNFNVRIMELLQQEVQQTSPQLL
jgi:hypothetical protein